MMYFYCHMFPTPSCCPPQTGGSLCQEQALLRSNSAAKSERLCNREPPNIHHRIVKWSAPKSSSSLPKEPRTSTSPNACPFPLRSCVAGESDSSRNAWPVWTSAHGEADLAFFPPHLVMEVKALACELPQQLGLPFSRLSHQDIADEAVRPLRIDHGD